MHGIAVFLAAALAWAPPARSETAVPAPSGEVPREVVIKPDSGDGMRTARPPLNFRTDEFESVAGSLGPDRDMLGFEPGGVSGAANYPEWISSARVIKPWRAALSGNTAVAFQPGKKLEESLGRAYTPAEAAAANWELTITDEEGKVFHKYSGTGRPPETIIWNGENDRREFMKAGHSYAPVYVFTCGTGAARTVIGDIVKFTAVVFQKGGMLNLGLDCAVLFGADRSLRVPAKPEGEELLGAAADIIKRRYYGLGIRVNVYGQNRELAQAQAQAAAKFLSHELMAGENAVSFEGFEEVSSRQRVDIVLAK